MKKILVLAMVTLTGCVAPRTQTPTAIYDFGLQQFTTPANNADASGNVRLQASLLVAEAATPAWLDSTAIHYRLAYHDPAQAYVYASNRWTSPPATLLTQWIRSRIAGISDGGVMSTADSVQTDYILRVELEEFTQVFDTTDQSRAVVKLRASLINRGTRSLAAQRSFHIEQMAHAPNATGAVRALTEASDKLIGDLLGWLVEELPEEKNIVTS
ncbi:ABC-type transport auxiliary lipoprotein family protein [Nitrosospira sp. Nsp1]|uniref:ABC-type transport auxiliary lipoprotein family protein n=1 Tax=Nitrosospira sp. Nsp1 TaxID=136547 RepID=UPI0008912191|nr:ABC-type transport auxiliary lipoprotein family protein [Nitrosospira sp. Nsp1]SCX42003.1 cholesterol transport system auxiliary component [Nitrosospira sp. Nsp1]